MTEQALALPMGNRGSSSSRGQRPAPLPDADDVDGGGDVTPPVQLTPGQLIEFHTSTRWLPGQVLKVQDGGWQVVVTAFEPKSDTSYKRYVLKLDNEEHTDRLAPFGEGTIQRRAIAVPVQRAVGPQVRSRG
jgi:hypothetical protein